MAGSSAIDALRAAEKREQRIVADLLHLLGAKEELQDYRRLLSSTLDSVQAEKEKMIKARKPIKDNLVMLWKLIQTPQKRAKLFAEIKQQVELIENNLNDLRNLERTTYQHLMSSEVTLTYDVALLQGLIPSWSMAAENVTSTSQLNMKARKVAWQEQAYIAKHGRYGGWDEDAHLAFLRIYNKLGTDADERIIQSCVERIPSISVNEARQHLKWWKSLDDLTQAKKAAIEHWKSMKATKVPEYIHRAPSSFMEEHKRQAPRKSIVKDTIVKESIKTWKEDRQRQLEEIGKEVKLRKQVEDLQHIQRQENERLRKQALLTQYRQQKRVEQLIKQKQDENNEPVQTTLSEEDLMRLKIRNAMIVDRKKLFIQKKEKREEQHDKIVDQLLKTIPRPSVPHDPSRVFKPTKVHEQRQMPATLQHDKREREAQSSFAASSVRLIQQRGTPSWRSGL